MHENNALAYAQKPTSCLMLEQRFPNFPARDPKSKSARDWGPPSTPEVACNIVHSHY